MYKYIALLVSVLFVSSALGCSDTPYKYAAPTKVLYASDLNASTLAYHNKWMDRAINIAWQLNGLFAAVIVDPRNDTEICTGINQGGNNLIFHGEIVAINNCSALTGKNSWENYYLYTTGEPCPMCTSAILWAHFDKVIYASSVRTLYCKKCMGQIAIDSNVITAYQYGMGPPGKFTPLEIVGEIMSNVTDTQLFDDYCNGTAVWSTTPYCNADYNPNGCSSSSATTVVVSFFMIAVTFLALLL